MLLKGVTTNLNEFGSSENKRYRVDSDLRMIHHLGAIRVGTYSFRGVGWGMGISKNPAGNSTRQNTKIISTVANQSRVGKPTPNTVDSHLELYRIQQKAYLHLGIEPGITLRVL